MRAWFTADVALPGRVEASIGAGHGEIVGLVGPNGSGKTSLLRSIAGTLAQESRVQVADQDWTGRPPQQRSVGLVHQDHLLFPHLTVLENAAFGLRARGRARGDARARAQDWLDRLGIGKYAGRRPDALSGGQAQRVALARALATEPQVLLLDEPFAALDVSVSIELRELLLEHLRDFPGVVLLASHEPLDVLALAGRVVVLEDGRVAQQDDLTTVSEAPATAHAARLLGLNVWRGTAAGSEVELADGGTLTTATIAEGPVLATFPPSSVTLTNQRPTGSARNAWHVRVRTAIERGTTTRLHLQGTHDLRADVTVAAAHQLGLVAGAEAWASVKATEVTVFPVSRRPEPTATDKLRP